MLRRLAIAVVLSAGLPLWAQSPTGAGDIAPLLEKYCYDCHGDGAAKGGFALDELLQKDGAAGTHGTWEKTWKMMRDGFMPPANADAPDAAEKVKLERWIEETKLGVDYARPDPGRVTMRRLNRMEYEFTVTDLFGTDIGHEGEFSSDATSSRSRLRDMLPPDDTAFGFDNIGDFQTLSPALLEKYLDLAEFVVDRVVSLHGPDYPVRPINAGGLKFERKEGGSRVEHAVSFEVPQDGPYRVDVQFALGGWQEYGGAYAYGLSIDDFTVAEDTVEVGGQKIFKYAPEKTLTKGAHRLTFFTSAVKPGADGRLTPLELRPKMKVTGPLTEQARVYPEPHRRLFFEGEAPAGEPERRDYARRILQRVADRAFRRPAAPGLLDRLSELVTGAEKFESGIAQGLMVILTSPQFLFRAEQQPQPDDPQAVHPIDEYALASRLSYLFWLSLPDEELTALAAKGGAQKEPAGAGAAHAQGCSERAVLRGLPRTVAAHAQRADDADLQGGQGHEPSARCDEAGNGDAVRAHRAGGPGSPGTGDRRLHLRGPAAGGVLRDGWPEGRWLPEG